jgi:hypothetical protein
VSSPAHVCASEAALAGGNHRLWRNKDTKKDTRLQSSQVSSSLVVLDQPVSTPVREFEPHAWIISPTMI